MYGILVMIKFDCSKYFMLKMKKVDGKEKCKDVFDKYVLIG